MSMTPENSLHMAVEVRVDGVWRPGTLEHRRRSGSTWEGFVRWSTGPGENRIGWFDLSDLRPGRAG